MLNSPKPRVLFLNGRLAQPLGVGGDATAMDIFLSKLGAMGYDLDAHCVINQTYYPASKEEVSEALAKRGVAIQSTSETITYNISYPVTVHAKMDIAAFLDTYFKLHPNTVVLTQLDLSRDALGYCIDSHKPVVVLIHDPLRNNLLTMDMITRRQNNVAIVFNSQFVQGKFEAVGKHAHTSVIYPPVSLDYFDKLKVTAKYITAINPVHDKGGKITFQLAQRFPDEPFLVVQGWYDPRKDGFDFAGLPNVTVLEKQDDIRKVYCMSKLLLVPSQWEEAFGMVAAEALAAGVPVLASKQGGLTETLGDAGFYVDDYADSQAWEKALRSFLELADDELVQHIARGRAYASKFDANHAAQHLAQVIEGVSAT